MDCMVRRASVALALAAAVAVAMPTAASARTLTFDDVRKEVGVSTATISPDGKSIAFLVTRKNFEKNTPQSQLMLVNVASGTKRALTQDRDDVNSPIWSPSGDRIAFIAQSGDGDDAQDQVYVMTMSGGDPVAITSAKNGVEQFVWSPDGSRIAFVTTDEKKPPKGTSISWRARHRARRTSGSCRRPAETRAG
jgi:Tol biopolymer transport system component